MRSGSAGALEFHHRAGAHGVAMVLVVFFAAHGPLAAAQPDRGRLHVVSAPVGEVELDGARTGRSTPVADLPVTPGDHVVVVRFPDGRRSSPARIRAAAGRASHVYARPSGPPTTDDACERGTHTDCFRSVEEALTRHDLPTSQRRAALYLRRFPDGGYHRVARNIVANAGPRRPPAGLPNAVVAGVTLGPSLLLLLVAGWQVRRRRS